MDWKQAEKICFNEWSNPDDEELGIQIVKVRNSRISFSFFLSSSFSFFFSNNSSHNKTVFSLIPRSPRLIITTTMKFLDQVSSQIHLKFKCISVSSLFFLESFL